MLPKIAKNQLGIPEKWLNLPARWCMSSDERAVLLTLIESVEPRSMIEFGVNEGWTARAVLDQIKTIQRYVGVDIEPDYEFELPEQQVERPNDPGYLVASDRRFELVLRSKNFGDPAMLSGTCETYDVAFIDGDHGHNAVLLDYRLAKHIVPRGIIIFHDYSNPSVQVTGALDELHATGSKLFHVEGTWLAYERTGWPQS